MSDTSTQLWEVFIQAKRGLSHVHVGSVRATDATMALQNARDVYTRRGEGESIWVVASSAIATSHGADRQAMFASGQSKDYRYPNFYEVPDDVTNM